MRTSLSSTLLVAVILVSTTLASSNLSITNSGAVSNSNGAFGRWFDYVVVIMLENHSINYTYGISVPPNSWNSTKGGTCLGNCTYFKSVADANSLAEGYTNTGVTDGSAGDYIAITSGNGTTPGSCNSGIFPYEINGCSPMQIPNIVDRLDPAHLSWKAYMEGCPGQCGGGPTGCANIDAFDGGTNYGPNHNPFIYYSDIQNNLTRCANIVSANSQPVSQNTCGPTPVVNDDLFINDLNSVSNASNYMFLTPNQIDDVHNCNDVTVGNDWLNKLVPQILNSTLFRTKRAALFITFDEPGCTNPPGQTSCPSAAPDLYSVWASNSTNPQSKTKVGFKSNLNYTHFSALKTIENNWGLMPLVASTDGSANDMQEFFRT